jgi:hypothetical protein
MTWKPREKKWDWRAFLTPDEKRVIAECDAALTEIRKLRGKYNRDLAGKRQIISNRAIQRAKYEASRT